MQIFDRPFQRWPLRWHVAAVSALVAAAVLLLVVVERWLDYRLSEVRTALEAAEQQVAAERSKAAQQVQRPSLRDTLPLVQRVDEVERDLLRYAERYRLVLATFTSQPGAVVGNGIGTVQYSLSLNAPYPDFKLWLADLLARYPSLAVLNLSMRASARTPGSPDITLTLLFAFKE